MKKIILIIIVLIIVGSGAFYGGLKYGQSKSPRLTLEQRQQFLQGNIEGNLQRGAGRVPGSSFLNGEVIDKDEQSLTLKIPDGGSKIVFFSDSTGISKTTAGSINDIEIGKTLFVGGKQNSDGSFTAETIQLSPLMPLTR